jgi:hypothetical protein
MQRLIVIAVLLGSLLLATTPASAQRVRAYYGRPYGYSPRSAYWNGYYANPGYYYRPYTTYYSYPMGPAYGYPSYYDSYYYPTPSYYYYGW